MGSVTLENICFQDKISAILTICLELETYIKFHHGYKEIWTPELGEQLSVRMEPDNRVGKFSVWVENDQAVGGHSKKWRALQEISDSLRSDTLFSCYAKVLGKRCSLKDGERLEVYNFSIHKKFEL